MCAVLKVSWVLVVTLSLVSCSVSPRRLKYQVQISFLLDFVIHFCTCSQTVFCDRQFFPVTNYCTLLHRENGSFEVLCLQLLKINSQNRHENGTPEQRLRTAVSAHQKTHSRHAAIRRQSAFDREVQSWAKIKRVGSQLAKSRFEKHVHACIVVSHVVNRARDACCSQSLT